eukprot:GHRR01029254.1.p1 GENE.GHRR01029254.1~~GHRR01029254.1.p1  ORF type:complete len:142 (+),score=22.07 GHRR01029254.1:723-1148(+)
MLQLAVACGGRSSNGFAVTHCNLVVEPAALPTFSCDMGHWGACSMLSGSSVAESIMCTKRSGVRNQYNVIVRCLCWHLKPALKSFSVLPCCIEAICQPKRPQYAAEYAKHAEPELLWVPYSCQLVSYLLSTANAGQAVIVS